MSAVDFFIKLGLFAQPGFLDPATCARIHQEARVASGIPGQIYSKGKGRIVDETKRRAFVVDLSSQTLGSIDARLDAITPQLEHHFGITLTSHEAPMVCVYRTGDFFGPHRDTSRNEEVPAHVRTRQVAAVLFISDPRDYRGGALMLYGLVDHEPWRSRGFQLESTLGLFVAFPPTLLHEVQPVLEGERVTIATFFS